MNSILRYSLVLVFSLNCLFAISQDENNIYDLLINKTIRRYSTHLIIRSIYPYSIANYELYNENYYIISYLPQDISFFPIEPDSTYYSKEYLRFNKFKQFGNHPIFWKSISDTTDFDNVLKKMIEYEFFKSLPPVYITERWLGVYYIFRKKDMKLIKTIRTKKYWKAYEFVDKLE